MASQGKTKPARRGESEMARRFRSNPLVFAGTFFVLVIVVIAFVFVPAVGPEVAGMGGDLTFGRYDRAPISYVPGNFFAEQVGMSLRYWEWRTGGELGADDRREIWRQSFEAAAVNAAILREMSRAGYEPPPRVVDREVASLPMFQENGRFSVALYRRLDENRRMALWRRTQDDIARSRFFADADRLLLPSAEGRFIGEMASTERSFSVAVFSVDAFPDSEIEAYALENSDLFRSAQLSMATIRGSEREARRIMGMVADGELSFGEAARVYSSDRFAHGGGAIGLRMAHELRGYIHSEAALDAALALGSGEMSDLVRTPEGWAFFRAEADAQDADLSDPIAMGRVRSYMRSFARGRMEDWALAQAGEFAALAGEHGFEEAAALHGEAAGFEVGTRRIEALPINFGSVGLFGSLPGQGVSELLSTADRLGFARWGGLPLPADDGADMSEHFWTAAFSTPIGRGSQPVVHGDSVLVLFPTEETAAHPSSAEIAAAEYAAWLGGFAGGQPGASSRLLHRHVMGSGRLDDRFQETFSRAVFVMP